MSSIKTKIVFIFTCISLLSHGQQKGDSIPAKSNSKAGWSVNALPVVAYDADLGFKYGVLSNLYDYGDGSIYPNYQHSIYLEWSRTTKESGINQIVYDSKYLIPGIRTSAEISYLTEKGLDFMGYNGYKSLYNSTYVDDSPENTDYLSRMFYKQDRRMLRLRADFVGSTPIENVQWIAGIVHYNIKLDTIDIAKLNDGKDEEDALPYIDGGLYGYYKEWSVIPDGKYYGGYSSLLKAGIAYDTRDNEPNPMHGVLTDLVFLWAPGIFGSDDPSYSKFSFTHRQYITLVKDQLSFAYRLSYQGKLHNSTPSYMLPIIFSYGRYNDRDGLGGSKNIRGVIRNRIVGDDMAFGNFELRWKFYRGILFNQNVYVALSTFTDLGMVTRDFEINTENVPTEFLYFFPEENEGMHQSLGTGLHFSMNENFIVAVDYGVALDKRDGDSGLYINMNWLF